MIKYYQLVKGYQIRIPDSLMAVVAYYTHIAQVETTALGMRQWRVGHFEGAQ